MKKHAFSKLEMDLFREGNGVLDWRAFSVPCRPAGISYLLLSGKQGTITDPLALRIFYRRIWKHRYEEENTRRSAGEQRPPP